MSTPTKKLPLQNQIALKVLTLGDLAKIGAEVALEGELNSDQLAAQFHAIEDLADWLDDALNQLTSQRESRIKQLEEQLQDVLSVASEVQL